MGQEDHGGGRGSRDSRGGRAEVEGNNRGERMNERALGGKRGRGERAGKLAAHDTLGEQESSGHTRARLYYYIMHGIFQKLAQCAPLSGYKENTQKIVTLLAPDARLSKNIIRNALETCRRQAKGSVGVCSNLSDRNLMKLGIGFTSKTVGSSPLSSLCRTLGITLHTLYA